MVQRVAGYATDRGASKLRTGAIALGSWLLVLVALATLVAAPRPADAQQPPAGTPPPSETTVRDEETGRRSNPAGAAAGLVLIAGWVVLGAVLFHQGRRRLAANATVKPSVDPAVPQVDHEMTHRDPVRHEPADPPPAESADRPTDATSPPA